MTDSVYSGRIALVTGASRGLGIAVARGLCMRGATVFALARTMGGLEELDDLVTAEGGIRPTLLPLDLTDREAVKRLGPAIGERHGRLDVLVHCAANAPPLSPVGHVAAKDLEAAWKVNGGSVQSLLTTLDPLFREADAARAVFMADPHEGKPFWGTYHATKQAGLAFARAYAEENGKSGFRAVFHQPPPMPTALRNRFFPGEDKDALTPCAKAAEGVLAVLEQVDPSR